MVRVHCFLCMTLLILLSAAAAGTMDVGYVQPSNTTMFHGVAGGIEWLDPEMATAQHITYGAVRNAGQPAATAAKGG
ncbi:unnamed protein product, partial [Musa hybrid cultivar]